jgi:hypothetical protein
VVTGFASREAVAVAEMQDGMLMPAGLVKFGLAGKELWVRLDRQRVCLETRSGLIPVRAKFVAGVEFFVR